MLCGGCAGLGCQVVTSRATDALPHFSAPPVLLHVERGVHGRPSGQLCELLPVSERAELILLSKLPPLLVFRLAVCTLFLHLQKAILILGEGLQLVLVQLLWSHGHSKLVEGAAA